MRNSLCTFFDNIQILSLPIGQQIALHMSLTHYIAVSYIITTTGYFDHGQVLVKSFSDCHYLCQNMTSTFLLPHKIDANNPTRCYKEGYLVKKGHRRKNWNRRFFVLNECVLSYFESEQSWRENQNSSKGSLKLTDYTVHDCVIVQGLDINFVFI